MVERKRILAILPIVYTEGIKGALEDRRRLAEEVEQRTGGLISLDATTLDRGTASIEGSYDEALNLPHILEKVREAEQKRYDAIVIDCFGDPGLYAARELVEIPVLGANESSCHLAARLAPRFSIINILPETEYLVRELIVRHGLLQHLASVVTVNIPVLDLEKDPEKSISKITQAAEKAVREDGASAVVLGCTGMSSLVEGVRSGLRARGINVPVIEPLRAAVYDAISWILMGVSHSKEAYRPPRKKLIKL
ncbi:aspartate/glutamate racemase family protein [Candidatus Bathyarchaeota archaeon]|nr:aspartate/glutamate racemase family protein [Candidatus Bathyarchaeota archaeon]